jgi:hypothetical protein
VNALLRWFRDLWRRPAASTSADVGPVGVGGGGTPQVDADGAAPRTPHRRHYTAPPTDDDPLLESRLGAVLQALRGGSSNRDELGARVDAADWGPGRFDAVLAHGVASGVLVETADGGVRARYAD